MEKVICFLLLACLTAAAFAAMFKQQTGRKGCGCYPTWLFGKKRSSISRRVEQLSELPDYGWIKSIPRSIHKDFLTFFAVLGDAKRDGSLKLRDYPSVDGFLTALENLNMAYKDKLPYDDQGSASKVMQLLSLNIVMGMARGAEYIRRKFIWIANDKFMIHQVCAPSLIENYKLTRRVLTDSPGMKAVVSLIFQDTLWKTCYLCGVVATKKLKNDVEVISRINNHVRELFLTLHTMSDILDYEEFDDCMESDAEISKSWTHEIDDCFKEATLFLAKATEDLDKNGLISLKPAKQGVYEKGELDYDNKFNANLMDYGKRIKNICLDVMEVYGNDIMAVQWYSRLKNGCMGDSIMDLGRSVEDDEQLREQLLRTELAHLTTNYCKKFLKKSRDQDKIIMDTVNYLWPKWGNLNRPADIDDE